MIYLGKHTDYSENGFDDYLGSGKLIIRAIKKYGKENFFKRIIKIYDTEEEVYIAERFYIAYYRGLGHTRNTMYNIAEGGEGGNNYAFKTTEEMTIARANISKAKQNVSDAARANMSKGGKGKILSDEHKANIGKAGKGRKLTDITKTNMSNAQKGNKKSDAHKIIISNQIHKPFYYKNELFNNKQICRRKYFQLLSKYEFEKYIKTNSDLFIFCTAK